MTGISWAFTTFVSLLIVTLVTAVLFVYVWLRSHGVSHTTHPHMTHARVDGMAGEEGED
jgi:hypothetical protein